GALPSGGEFSPIARILVSATVDECLEVAIGDFGASGPVVRQRDAVFSAAGDEDHPREFAANRAKSDRTTVDVRPAHGSSRRPDFESGLDRLQSALCDSPRPHAQ